MYVNTLPLLCVTLQFSYVRKPFLVLLHACLIFANSLEHSWTKVMRGDEAKTRTLLSHSYGYPLMSFCVLAQ